METSKQILIDAIWDDEAEVWVASSDVVPGLVVEADTWTRLLDEIARSFTVRVESHVSLTAA
jgi:hypothetical protein